MDLCVYVFLIPTKIDPCGSQGLLAENLADWVRLLFIVI